MDVNGATIVVTGGTGFLGGHVCSELERAGAKVEPVGHARYDLRLRTEIDRMLADTGPDAVVHLAAVVGGIGANRAHPGQFLYENAIIGLELLEACRVADVAKTVVAGTVCAYPKHTPVPFREEHLWNGYPEETNAPYGLAKKLLLAQCQAYRAEYGMNAIYLLPVNLYGPGDNFDLETSHVIPAMIRRFAKARDADAPSVTLWGDGSATREFLYVEDAARAFRLALECFDDPDPINIGSGKEISIKDLAELVAEVIGYFGEIAWDATRPNGQPRRCLDTSRASKLLGFEAEVGLKEGLRRTITWFSTEATSMVSPPLTPAHPAMSRRIEKSYLRASTFAASSRVEKLRQAPIRSVAVEAASRTCRRLGWTLNVRAKTFWGAQMNLLLPEVVSEQVLRCRLFEPSVTAYMLRLLRPGDVFIDVGAHFGYFTLLGAWLTRDVGQVHSFEPTPSTFQMLVKNTRNYKKARLNQLAVWSQCATLTINDFGRSLSAFNSAYSPRLHKAGSNAAESALVQVQAVALDDYCDEQDILPRFVKIDAESAEHEIVRGMNDLLTQCRPSISVEVGDFNLTGVSRSVDLLKSVMDYGYMPFDFDSSTIKVHRPREDYSYDNILLVPEEYAKEISGS